MAAVLMTASTACGIHHDFRQAPAQLRRCYNQAFFWRHNGSFETGAAIHFTHGRAHDILQMSALDDALRVDAEFDAEATSAARHGMRMEPSMMLYGPHTGMAAWRLYLAIDWTHHHHEVTYDIMSDEDVDWRDKPSATREAVRYYLDKLREARSPAAARAHDAAGGRHDEAVLHL